MNPHSVVSPTIAQERAERVLKKNLNGIYMSNTIYDLCDVVEQQKREIEELKDKGTIQQIWTLLKSKLVDRAKRQKAIGYHLRSKENDDILRIMHSLEKGLK
jgi:hypothetical protein